MTDMLRVKLAKEGTIVRHPRDAQTPGKLLGTEPEEVPNTTYWRRRILGGDVVLAPLDAPIDEPKAKKAKLETIDDLKNVR